jgi:tetratricopeptide (TPR) repeat protein
MVDRNIPLRSRIRGRFLVLLIAALLPIGCATAQEDNQDATAVEDVPAVEAVGNVHFETSCVPAVGAQFDRAVALLHSFWFPVAIEAFNDVLIQDPNCSIAYWGIALSQWGNPFAGGPSPDTVQGAWENVQTGLGVGDRTQRESDYLSAAGALYEEGTLVDQRTRTLNYVSAMEQLTEIYPDDSEARIFYALSLTATALPTDKTYGNQLQAAAILEVEFEEQPDHPGIAHYIIHSYDHPPLASRGLSAARRYASLAPSIPHALHMPSHIFTRVGDWEASIATNIRSAETALRTNTIGSALHAFDYLTYAYLQTAQDEAAMDILGEASSLGAANPFAVAAIPARFAIEREAWLEASELEVVPAPSTPQAEAMTRFVRAMGFARIGDAVAAQAEVAELDQLRAALVEMNDAYWAEQVAIQWLGASAWSLWAQGENEEALALLRSAARREDATDKSPSTPGPLKPAREQLGELLLELENGELALVEFEATMNKEPNRFRAIYGAASAAQLSGDVTKAEQYYVRLLEISEDADTERPELDEARQATTPDAG